MSTGTYVEGIIVGRIHSVYSLHKPSSYHFSVTSRLKALLAVSILSASLFIVSPVGRASEGDSFRASRQDLLQSAFLVKGKPVRIQIPSRSIDLPITDGVYDPATQKWSLSKTTASYAVTTPLANNVSGNTFIYGHNNQQVFSNLLPIQPGDAVMVSTDTGKTFTYVYRSSFDVKPGKVEAVRDHGGPVLTVQTCVGDYLTLRRMFIFDYVRVDG